MRGTSLNKAINDNYSEIMTMMSGGGGDGDGDGVMRCR